VKFVRVRGRHPIAVTLSLMGLVGACGGDHDAGLGAGGSAAQDGGGTGGVVQTGGSGSGSTGTGGNGPTDASSGVGGAAGTGGSMRAGGSAGMGGSAGTGGNAGTGGGANTDATGGTGGTSDGGFGADGASADAAADAPTDAQDAAPEVASATDGGATDARTTDAGSVQDAPGDAAPSCDGGNNPYAYTFDTTTQGWGKWVADLSNPNGTRLEHAANEGMPCPGALRLSVDFSYGQTASAAIFYGDSMNGVPADWSGKSKLHAWIKLESGMATALNGIQLFVQNASVRGPRVFDYDNWNNAWLSGWVFSDNGWHEEVLDLTNGFSGSTSLINQIGVQVDPLASAPAGGPASPGTIVVDIDNVWLE